jgi:hypothetical protein
LFNCCQYPHFHLLSNIQSLIYWFSFLYFQRHTSISNFLSNSFLLCAIILYHQHKASTRVNFPSKTT